MKFSQIWRGLADSAQASISEALSNIFHGKQGDVPEIPSVKESEDSSVFSKKMGICMEFLGPVLSCCYFVCTLFNLTF